MTVHFIADIALDQSPARRHAGRFLRHVLYSNRRIAIAFPYVAKALDEQPAVQA